MEKKWDGKSKGSLLGYQFFILCIQLFGIRIAYFFCGIVSFYFALFASKQRKALVLFYQTGFNYSKLKANWLTVRNFNQFGRVLIDRIALKTKRKSRYTHTFDNERVLHEIHQAGKGGFLFSGHVGNWENAGNLIAERITSKINILMLDAEVERIKSALEKNGDATKFNLIPLKEDMSHVVLIHQALKRNELIALHSDRMLEGQKVFRLPFLNGLADFPAGPFIMASKFKVPLTFVFALKETSTHYGLSATDPIMNFEDPEIMAKAYVKTLEEKVIAAPEQWFNFYNFYAS